MIRAGGGFDERLRERLAASLPGTEAQVEMAPVYRRDPSMARIEGKTCREAAVLAVLHPSQDGVRILLIERPSHLNHHAGQVAFPGGRREAGEALLETALRETEEELGLDRSAVRVLGGLTPLYIPPSGYCVHPFVAWTDVLPALRPEPGEVADWFTARLADLKDPACRQEVERSVRGQTFTVPAFHVEGRHVWGATAMMLSELVAAASGLDP